MPIPITIPPRIWLRPVFKLITRPQSITLTQRVTRTNGSSGSIFTSQNCAPKLWKPIFSFSLNLNLPSAAIDFVPARLSAWPNESGLLASPPSSASFFFKFSAASTIAEPAVAVVWDPPATGPKGKFESPNSIFTFSTGIPIASAAIWVSEVY